MDIKAFMLHPEQLANIVRKLFPQAYSLKGHDAQGKSQWEGGGERKFKHCK